MPAMIAFPTPIPLSLYIHIPWCVRKCPYCDFNSHEIRNTMPEENYVAALLQDLQQQLPPLEQTSLTSIFFGGGTPSVFSASSIEKILIGVNQALSITPTTEITLEANPGTVDQQRFKDFRAAGVNRLSIGIQSLQNDKLKALGRIHDKDAALRAIESVRSAGFDNFNVDMMYGLPGQSLTDALFDIETALQFFPPHFSWYQLTLEPNTLFHHQPPVLPSEEAIFTIQMEGQAKLAAAGWQQYEVSAYAQPGQACRHNRHYWEFGDYLGIGAGAHSKLTHRKQERVTRHWQVKNPRDYLDPEKSYTASHKTLSAHDLVFEFMLNALRLTEGVPIQLFTERTGLPLAAIEHLLTQAQDKKLLEKNREHLRPTALGQRFLNDLVGMFL